MRVKHLNDGSAPGESGRVLQGREWPACTLWGQKEGKRQVGHKAVAGPSGGASSVGSPLRVRGNHGRDGCREEGDLGPAERVHPAIPLQEGIAQAPLAPCDLTDTEAQECGSGAAWLAGLTSTVALQYRAQPLFRLLTLPV